MPAVMPAGAPGTPSQPTRRHIDPEPNKRMQTLSECILSTAQQQELMQVTSRSKLRLMGVVAAFRVMTVSFHQFGNNFFPGSGDLKDVGERRGKFYSLNVPLQQGTTDATFHSLFKPIVSKVVEIFNPSAIVLQCGEPWPSPCYESCAASSRPIPALQVPSRLFASLGGVQWPLKEESQTIYC